MRVTRYSRFTGFTQALAKQEQDKTLTAAVAFNCFTNALRDVVDGYTEVAAGPSKDVVLRDGILNDAPKVSSIELYNYVRKRRDSVRLCCLFSV